MTRKTERRTFASKHMTEDMAVRLVLMSKLNRAWVDRAASMLRSLCRSNTTPTTVSDMTVNPRWPLEGDIRFTRDADGKRFSLRLEGNKWIGAQVA